MAHLTELPLTLIAKGLQRGDFTSRELTQAFLDRIDRLEPQLQCFITITADIALEQADSADRKLKKSRESGGKDIHPLTGIPIAIKDVFTTKGIRSTAGSRILENFIPPYHATVVERLLEAGMVLLGKTNMDEFSMGSSTENSAYKTSRNPWKIDRVPGGSSGGSAAAVAARLAPIALGSDTGGSIRQPAAYCGITGLKPTYGRVSRYGLIAYGSSLDCVGVLSPSVIEVSETIQVISGQDPSDASCADLPKISIKIDDPISLQGIRIGIPQEYFIEGIQGEVEFAVRGALGLMEKLGVEILPISLPHTEYSVPVYYLLAPAEASANLARYDGVRYGPRFESDSIGDVYRKTRGQLFGREVKRRIMLGTYALSSGYYDEFYGKAQKVRKLIRQDFLEAFEKVDIIAAPVTPTTAFKIGAHSGDPLSMYLEDVLTIPANLAGVPGLAFPVGFDNSGLPIGMQLMASHFQEEKLLQIGHRYQCETKWHTRIPNLLSN